MSFFDKTGRTGSKAQLINGIFLLSSFFGVRLVYGGKVVRLIDTSKIIFTRLRLDSQSINFIKTLHQVRHLMPWKYIFVYGIGNVVLTSLNWFWFSKMITALRRRFEDDSKDQRPLLDGGATQA
ncbi:hypothetical protein H0H93_012269 [Arthromyces matolae]|nr:hypothetical protein H0H93_012269 [Arthromyces matolae]